MAFDLLTAQRAATVILNASVAVLAASTLARRWLGGASSPWAASRRLRLGRWSTAGVLLALLASGVLLWLQAAVMAEVPLAQALGAIQTVLAASHYGVAWAISAAALAGAGVWLAITRRQKSARAELLVFAPLAMFWYARCMSSHAADDGDASLFMLVYSVHLALISLWVGEVLVAGLAVLGGSGRLQDQDLRARGEFVQHLSDSATLVLAGIFLSGAYLAWHILPSAGDLFRDPYGRTLLAKLAFVGTAAAMGGFNRFFVMPPLATADTASAGSEAAAIRFRRVVRAEAVVLLAALAIAAVLGSTAPPGAGP